MEKITSNNNGLKILLVILILNLCLTLYGIRWGLPDRWNTDEHVAKALRLLSSRSVFTVVDTAHPQAYDILLGIWMIPYLAVLKLIGYPLAPIQAAASVSWVELASKYPNFAVGSYVWGRLSSVILNLLSIMFVYRIALLIYKRYRLALTAALIVGLSMGFIEIGHFTKSTALVAMLVLAAAYYAFKAININFEKNFYIASILGGAAVSVQADGAFSLVYLAATAFLYLKDRGISKRTLKTLLIAAILFTLTFFILWPALVVNRQIYSTKAIAGFSMRGMPGPGIIMSKVAENIKFTCYLFSPLLAVFVWCGIFYSAWKWREYSPYTQIFILVLVPYISMATIYFAQFPGAYTKFLIHAIPILSIWAALFINDFLQWRIPGRNARLVLVVFVFLTAILYAIRGSAVFAKDDTRYYSGRWIEGNIPSYATIEHFQEVDVLFPARILKTHSVIFYGRDSKNYAGKKFYDILDKDSAISYMNGIGMHGPTSDYILIASGKDFLLPAYLEAEERRDSIIYKLMEGRQKGYELVKRIESKDSVFTDPKPGYTSPTISVFKRIER